MQITQQEIFDIVAPSLLSQNEQSLNEYGDCSYRGTGSLKCAVGMCITDEEYTFRMEDNDVAELVNQLLLPKHLVPHTDFLTQLQELHDCNEPYEWKIELEDLAHTYNLTASYLLQVTEWTAS